jgi:hypothetical protein
MADVRPAAANCSAIREVSGLVKNKHLRLSIAIALVALSLSLLLVLSTSGKRTESSSLRETPTLRIESVPGARY